MKTLMKSPICISGFVPV